MFLEVSGYEVILAHDARSALKSSATLEFDVFLCDLNLPDGNGWELMQKMRKRGPVRGIAYSAFDEPEQIERSKAAGFIEHVVKGATPETLVSAIDRAVQGEKLAKRKARSAAAEL